MTNKTNNLTEEQFLILSNFSYLDFIFNDHDKREYCGKTLKEISETLLTQDEIDRWYFEGIKGGTTAYEFEHMLKRIASDKTLGSLRLKDFEDDNGKSGFVAYAFNDDSGNIYFALRGSETVDVEDITKIKPYEGIRDFLNSEDWLDNFDLGINEKSNQFKYVEDFVLKNKGNGQNYVTGHSKGGANALYACAAVDGCTGIAFDAPGIGQALTEEQLKRLIESGAINYVAEGDTVGAILEHPENRIFVKATGEIEEIHDIKKQYDELRRTYGEDYSEEELLKKIEGYDPRTCTIVDIVEDGKKRKIMTKTVKGVFSYHYPESIAYDNNGKTMIGTRTELSKQTEALVSMLLAINKDSYRSFDNIVSGIEELSSGIDNAIISLKNLKEGTFVVIDENMDSMKAKLNDIIISGAEKIGRNIAELRDNTEGIKMEIEKGFKDMNMEIAREMEAFSQRISKEVSEISISTDKLLEILNLKQDSHTIDNDADENELLGKIKQMQYILVYAYTLKTNITDIRNEIIRHYTKRAAIVYKEAMETLWNIKDELCSIVSNTIQIGSIILIEIKKIEQTIKEGFQKAITGIIKEISEFYKNIFKSIINYIKYKAHFKIASLKIKSLIAKTTLKLCEEGLKNSMYTPSIPFQSYLTRTAPKAEVKKNNSGIQNKTRITVKTKDLEKGGEELRRISSKVEQIEKQMASISRSLDWDVKSRNGIDREMQEINKELSSIKSTIYNSYKFLTDASKQYEEAERKLNKSLGALI